MSAVASRPVLVVCALAAEAARLRPRRGRRADPWPKPSVIGPGPDSSRRLDALLAAFQARGETPLVILAGLAGGLLPKIAVGRAYLVESVRDETGRSRTCATRRSTGMPATSIVTVSSPVTTPAEKSALHERSNAALVDCESASFVEVCSRYAAPWFIVRGVSDGPDDRLPESIAGWVDEHGRSRIVTIAASCVSRPRTAVSVILLAIRSFRAMGSVRRTLRELLAGELRR